MASVETLLQQQPTVQALEAIQHARAEAQVLSCCALESRQDKKPLPRKEEATKARQQNRGINARESCMMQHLVLADGP